MKTRWTDPVAPDGGAMWKWIARHEPHGVDRRAVATCDDVAVCRDFLFPGEPASFRFAPTPSERTPWRPRYVPAQPWRHDREIGWDE